MSLFKICAQVDGRSVERGTSHEIAHNLHTHFKQTLHVDFNNRLNVLINFSTIWPCGYAIDNHSQTCQAMLWAQWFTDMVNAGAGRRPLSAGNIFSIICIFRLSGFDPQSIREPNRINKYCQIWLTPGRCPRKTAENRLL